MARTRTPKSTDVTARTRAILATVIVCISIGGIIGLSLLAILVLDGTDRTEMTRQVFSAVLPLLGTWVGTVLAFYFARESLQAATDSTSQLVGRRGPQTPVHEVMIPPSRMVAHTVAAGVSPESILLGDLMAEMRAAGRHRIPILNSDGVVAYVVHEATITKFIAIPPVPARATAPPTQPLTGQTVANLIAVPELADLVNAMGYVAINATVADARSEMRRVPNCNDVFVTVRGRSDEPVVGWLTNTDLAGMTEARD